ncbi:RDD family protein [Mucilaginibacter auburnensis]|uniref:Putative RDD family membrane protein YckC n=1 Tax=Mucilaginibacter auburnensis TaxID=1457233 RepID=A0A2H9VSN7_9SPHI|nr:RDD family protein [Mucilaginibacter auburnensis]PJJ83837.1 putative RDD family membrane protein YckC [Mucilaginibacter auburnensis]
MQTVRITTSQNIDIEYEIAGLGPRILARILDGLLFGLVIIFFVLFPSITSVKLGEIGIAIVVIAFFSLFVFYDLLCEIFMNGQSIGKRVMKIKVISADGGRPTLGQYLLRWLFRIVDFTMTGGVCALICAAVSEKNQRVGDMVAGTVLVRTEPSAKMEAIAFTPPVEEAYTPAFTEASQLKDKDIALIHEVLTNYIQSGNSVILYNTAVKLKQVLGIQTQMDDMRFLQTLIKDYNYIVATANADELA